MVSRLGAMNGVVTYPEIFLGKNTFCNTAANRTIYDKMEMTWGRKPWVNSGTSTYFVDGTGQSVSSSSGIRRHVSSSSDIRSQISCCVSCGFFEDTIWKWPLNDVAWKNVDEKGYLATFQSFILKQKAIGSVIQHVQIHITHEVLNYFRDHDVKVIFLQRSNYIAHHFASSAMGHLNEHHEASKFPVSAMNSTKSYLPNGDAVAKSMTASCVSVMKVFYETYTSNFSSFIEIYQYLGIHGWYTSDVRGSQTVISYKTADTSGNVTFDTSTKHVATAACSCCYCCFCCYC
jgi:hypothetical protein